MFDMHSNMKVVKGNANAAITGDTTGVTVGVQGYQSAELVADFGTPVTTLCTANHYLIKLQSAPDNGAGAPGVWAAVTDEAEVIGATPDAAGTILTVNTNAKAANVYRVGYIGKNPWVRANVDVVGTIGSGTPISLVWALGHPRSAPVPDQAV